MPRPPGASEKFTAPAFDTSGSPTLFQAMISSGTSFTISASHSTVRPAGAFACQCERVGESTRTETRCSMNRGRFWKLRQNANSSARGLSIVTERSTFTAFLAFTVAARPVTSSRDEGRSTLSASPVLTPSAWYTTQRPVAPRVMK